MTLCDVVAERQVLGILLVAPQHHAEVADLLGPSDFWRGAHRTIFEAITRVARNGHVVDSVTVGDALDRAGQLESVGGIVALTDLVTEVGPTTNVAYHAEKVADLARRRRIIEQAHRLAAAVSNLSAPLDDSLKRELAELSEHGRPATPVDIGNGPPWRHPAYDGATFLLDAPTHVPAVWGDADDVLWSSREPLMLCGPTGVGKTTIGQQLALACIGLADRILGYPVTTSDRVLYIAADRPEQARRSMQRMVTTDDRDMLWDRLVFWNGPLPFHVGQADVGALAEFVAMFHVGAVFIDSLKDIAIKLTDDEVGARVNTAIQHTLEVADVASLHYLRKPPAGSRKPQTINELYGSVWIPAGAGSVVVLWGEPGDAIVELTHLKQPQAPIGPLKIRHDHDRGYSEVIPEPDALDVLRGARQGISAADVARVLFETVNPKDSQIEHARRRLNKLVDRRFAVKRDGSLGGSGGSKATALRTRRRPPRGAAVSTHASTHAPPRRREHPREHPRHPRTGAPTLPGGL